MGSLLVKETKVCEVIDLTDEADEAEEPPQQLPKQPPQLPPQLPPQQPPQQPPQKPPQRFLHDPTQVPEFFYYDSIFQFKFVFFYFILPQLGHNSPIFTK